MVLESLTTPDRAEKSPWDLFFIGAMYAALAVFLAIWIFREEASIVLVLLTVIACMPLIFNTIKYEEEKDLVVREEKILLKEHWRALSFFMCLFVGFVAAFSLAYVFLPPEVVKDVFRSQENTIRSINAEITPGEISAQALGSGIFMQILSNNLKVLMFCIFFSFFYGAGAIFILTWNASVISAAIGSFVRNNLGSYATEVGFLKVGGYFHIFGLGTLRYFIHGLPEILAYFIGGLAGGIISVAVIRHDIGTDAFKRVLLDSVDLILLAIFVLFVAAGIEVYITPTLF